MDTRPNGPDSNDSKAKPETAPNPKAKATRGSSRSKAADTSETPLATMGSDGVQASAADASAPKARRAGSRAPATSTDGADGAAAEAKPKRAAASSRSRATKTTAGPSSETSSDGSLFTAGGAEPSHDDIAARAYELYQQRGGGDGDHVDDWHQAERDLRERSGQ